MTEPTIPVEAIVMRTYTRPNILSLLEFKDADFFEPEGSERLAGTDPEVALVNMLERCELAFCGGAAAYLDTTTMLVGVVAYRRMPVDDFYRKGWPEALVERLREDFSEEHGDVDGEDRLSDDDAKELLTRMQGVVDWYLTRVNVFQCETARTWRFDNDDLRELVTQLKPEWLEPKR